MACEGLECSACRKSCKLDLFRCAQRGCNFNLHYECSLLPPTITSEHHGDPLVLRKSYKEDDYTRGYYCDICERRRNPKKWVYFCETNNCQLVAHIECASSPVKLEVIREDDFVRRKDDIQKLEEEIKIAQQEADAKEESLRSLMADLEPMRAKLESQRADLEELKTEHAKWINMEVTEEDKSKRGEGDVDAADGELKRLRATLEKLNRRQAKWAIDFLRTSFHLNF